MRKWAMAFHQPPRQVTTEPNTTIQDATGKKVRVPIGIYYPPDVVKLGYVEWRKTGIIPDPRRYLDIDPHWIEDLNNAHQLVEYHKPPEQDNNNGSSLFK